jgi:hypothetical protein
LSIEGIEAAAMPEDPQPSVSSWDLFRRINLWDAAPSTRISIHAEESALESWVTGCLGRLGEAEEYFIALTEFWGLPWAKIRVQKQSAWLFHLWEQLQPRELLLLSPDQDSMLGFIDEESHYLAYLHWTAELLQQPLPGDL